MEIGRRAAQLDIERDQAAHADARGGDVERPHAGVGHDDDVAGQSGPLPPQQHLEVRRAHLLLAFDDELHVDRERTVTAQEAADGLQLVQHLALVVDGAPRPALVAPTGIRGALIHRDGG